MIEKKFIRDFQTQFAPKSPSPRTQITKEDHDKIYYAGWNDCMAHLKAAGKI